MSTYSWAVAPDSLQHMKRSRGMCVIGATIRDHVWASERSVRLCVPVTSGLPEYEAIAHLNCADVDNRADSLADAITAWWEANHT